MAKIDKYRLPCSIPKELKVDYPVLTEYETIVIQTKFDRLEIYYGYQDGFVVGGWNWQKAAFEQDSFEGAGYLPSRHGGEFRCVHDVLSYYLERALKVFKRPDMLDMIRRQIATRPADQLSLFN